MPLRTEPRTLLPSISSTRTTKSVNMVTGFVRLSEVHSLPWYSPPPVAWPKKVPPFSSALQICLLTREERVTPMSWGGYAAECHLPLSVPQSELFVVLAVVFSLQCLWTSPWYPLKATFRNSLVQLFCILACTQYYA